MFFFFSLKVIYKAQSILVYSSNMFPVLSFTCNDSIFINPALFSKSDLEALRCL